MLLILEIEWRRHISQGYGLENKPEYKYIIDDNIVPYIEITIGSYLYHYMDGNN